MSNIAPYHNVNNASRGTDEEATAGRDDRDHGTHRGELWRRRRQRGARRNDGGRAGKSSSQVAQALLGEQAGDLRGLIKSSASVFEQLASRESELSDLVTNFSITTGALAAESQSLEDTLAELAPTVEQAQRDLPVINSAFPPLRAFARELTPSVKELPATIRAGMPWLRQTDKLVQKSELGGIVDDLHASTPVLSQGTANLSGLLLQLGRFSRCQSQILTPTGNQVISDDFSTGQPSFRDISGR